MLPIQEAAVSTRLTATDVTICACGEDHVAAIATIYAHHVLHGLASFEIEPPSENDMRRRRLDIVSRNYPYLVAECAGEVVGYAYASPYRLRPAYRHTAENSVYLHPDWVGRGIGRQLMWPISARSQRTQTFALARCGGRGLCQRRGRRRQHGVHALAVASLRHRRRTGAQHCQLP